ncbi:unnamed protein product [Agarophyton chilense]
MAIDLYLITATGAFGAFGMLFVLGANDVANSVGVPIGSGALSTRTAIMLAATCNILGASLAGSRVAHTLSKGVSPSLAEDPSSYEAAMAFLCVLLSAMTIIFIGTVLALPLSSTHAVVGAVAGAAVLLNGPGSLHWQKLYQIATAWIVSPLLGCVLGFFLLHLTSLALRGKRFNYVVAPSLAGLTAAAVAGVLTDSLVQISGSEHPSRCNFFTGLTMAFALGFVGGWLVVNGEYEKLASESLPEHSAKLFAEDQTDGSDEEPEEADTNYGMARLLRPKKIALTENSWYFGALLVTTVPALSFAHGSNDVSNGVGPFIMILRYYLITVSDGKIDTVQRSVLLGVLCTGGVAIALGLSIFGARVIATIGGSGEKSLSSKPWTFARAFPAQFAAACSVLMASSFGLPVSTSHAVVGAVVGVQLASASHVNWQTLTNILVGAGLTPILAAITCIILLSVLLVAL